MYRFKYDLHDPAIDSQDNIAISFWNKITPQFVLANELPMSLLLHSSVIGKRCVALAKCAFYREVNTPDLAIERESFLNGVEIPAFIFMRLDNDEYTACTQLERLRYLKEFRGTTHLFGWVIMSSISQFIMDDLKHTHTKGKYK